MNRRVLAAVVGSAALVVPAAAVGNPGHGSGVEKKAAKEVVKGKGKAKKVMFVFKGTFVAPSTVDVRSGNGHVRKGGFVGNEVSFDFAGAKVVVTDTNADQKADLADVADGDRVLVQARVPRGTEYSAPTVDETADAVVARKLIDQTHPPVEDE